MEKIYLHLLSDFNAVFKIKQNDKTSISVNSLECLSDFIDLELIHPSDFEILVYPIQKKENLLFSYVAKFVFLNNELKSENNYVKTYKLPENHFFIDFLPFYSKKNEIIGEKIEIN
jgi:hypothetical protein